jgi:hypothetical protein
MRSVTADRQALADARSQSIAATRRRGPESPDQNMASGFTISPVLPGTSGGATTSRNSH